MGKAAVRARKITRRQIEEADQVEIEDLIPVFLLNEDPPPLQGTLHLQAASEWVVDGDRTSGSVAFLGRPGFKCLYTRLSFYPEDEFNQELAVHDADRGRVFHDFRWVHQEATGQQLADLVKVMQRQVAALVGR